MGLGTNINQNLPDAAAGGPEDSYLRMDDVRVMDVQIIDFLGEPIGILNTNVVVVINENLFENHLHGVAMNIDSANLPSNVPFTGNEMLQIMFKTPGGKYIEKMFIIDKMLSRGPSKNRQSQAYDIHFVDPLFMQNIFTKISQSYPNQLISKTVTDIFNTHVLQGRPISEEAEEFKLNIVEPTQGTTNVIIPGWGPFKAINWLSKRAVSQKQKGVADYVFYQDLDGFNFCSVSSFFDSDIKQEYIFGVTNSLDVIRPHPKKEIDLESTFMNIRNLQINGYDRSKETMKGMFSSSLLYHNILTKSHGSVPYEYMETFKGKNHVNEFPLIPDNKLYSPKVNSKYNYVSIHNGLYGDLTTTNLNSSTDEVLFYMPRHRSQILQSKSSSVEFEIAGDSERRVGDKVYVDIHSFEGADLDGQVKHDKLLSGNYIITSISHIITKTKGHYCRLKCSKDSYEASLGGARPGTLNDDGAPVSEFDGGFFV